MGPAREISGGSAANSMAGRRRARARRAAFIGQVADDQLGDIFAHDMRSLGVRFETPPISADGPPTGRCLILVTPDAQRTMNTCPGASHELTVEALDEQLIRSAAITFLEGYLWGPERPRVGDAARRPRSRMRRAHGRLHLVGEPVHRRPQGRRARHDRRRRVDVLFANEDEALHLTGAADLDGAFDELSANGQHLGRHARRRGRDCDREGRAASRFPQLPVERVVDTTGAGDLFAAGFLAARCRARPLERCLEAGALAAAKSSRISARGPKRTSGNLSACEQR